MDSLSKPGSPLAASALVEHHRHHHPPYDHRHHSKCSSLTQAHDLHPIRDLNRSSLPHGPLHGPSNDRSNHRITDRVMWCHPSPADLKVSPIVSPSPSCSSSFKFQLKSDLFRRNRLASYPSSSSSSPGSASFTDRPPGSGAHLLLPSTHHLIGEGEIVSPDLSSCILPDRPIRVQSPSNPEPDPDLTPLSSLSGSDTPSIGDSDPDDAGLSVTSFPPFFDSFLPSNFLQSNPTVKVGHRRSRSLDIPSTGSSFFFNSPGRISSFLKNATVFAPFSLHTKPPSEQDEHEEEESEEESSGEEDTEEEEEDEEEEDKKAVEPEERKRSPHRESPSRRTAVPSVGPITRYRVLPGFLDLSSWSVPAFGLPSFQLPNTSYLIDSTSSTISHYLPSLPHHLTRMSNFSIPSIPSLPSLISFRKHKTWVELKDSVKAAHRQISDVSNRVPFHFSYQVISTPTSDVEVNGETAPLIGDNIINNHDNDNGGGKGYILRIFFLCPVESSHETTLHYCDLKNSGSSVGIERNPLEWKQSIDWGDEVGATSQSNLGLAQKLQLERKRMMLMGITSYNRVGDRFVISLGNNLYMLNGEVPFIPKRLGPLEPTISTSSDPSSDAPIDEPIHKMDPQMCPFAPDLIAYVSDDDVHVVSYLTKQEIRLTNFKQDNKSGGTPSYVIQEEFGRYTGFWWAPSPKESQSGDNDSNGQKYTLLVEVVDESGVDGFELLTDDGELETYKFPQAGRPNATSQLAAVTFRVDNQGMMSLEPDAPWIPSLHQFDHQAEYLVRAGWLDSDTIYTQTLNRAQKVLKLSITSVSRSFPTQVLHQEVSTSFWAIHSDTLVWLNPEVGPIKVGTKLFLLWASDRTGFCHLYVLQKEVASTNQLQAQMLTPESSPVSQGFFYPVTGGDWEVDASSVTVDMKRKLVYLMGNRDTPLEKHLYVVSLLPALGSTFMPDIVPSLPLDPTPMTVESSVLETSSANSSNCGSDSDQVIPEKEVDMELVESIIVDNPVATENVVIPTPALNPMKRLTESGFSHGSCTLDPDFNYFVNIQSSVHIPPFGWLNEISCPDLEGNDISFAECIAMLSPVPFQPHGVKIRDEMGQGDDGPEQPMKKNQMSSKLIGQWDELPKFHRAAILVPNQFVTSIDTSIDTRVLDPMDGTGLFTSPSVTITALDATGSMSGGVSSSNDLLPGMPKPEIFSYQLKESGDTVYGCIFKPDYVESGVKYPVLLEVYGGPEVQTVTNSFKSIRQGRRNLLAQEGYVVCFFDCRGSHNRGKKFEGHLYNRMGQVEIADQVEVLQYLAAKTGIMDMKRVAIHGWSYGGYLTLMGLVQRPDIFKVAVAGAPVVKWSLYDSGYTERYMGLPNEQREAYDKGSVLNYVHQFPDEENRLLLIHGLMDENVHFRHTSKLVTALIKAGKPYSLQIYPTERHSLRNSPCYEHYECALLSYLQQHL